MVSFARDEYLDALTNLAHCRHGEDGAGYGTQYWRMRLAWALVYTTLVGGLVG